jgi:MoaA/NifB/PqqE/SkfB family radical SAM enzyme
MRNVWDVEYGRMSDALFDSILSGLDERAEELEIFIAGHGEALSHPRVLSLVKQAKERGHHVSLITNGILLT